MFLENIENPVKVRNQLKRMYKQNAQFCYTWDFETRQVCGLDKSEYVASLYEVQINGLVKRCECWVKQRFLVQKKIQAPSERRNSSSERGGKSPKLSAINTQSNSNNFYGSGGYLNTSNNANGHYQNGHTAISSPLVPQHDKFVIRFESYGHSKRERMTQSINPLSYAFDKILVDYVYLFIETEEVSKQKLIKEINKSIQNARYYDATRKVTMLEDVFNEKNTPLLQGFLNTINNKKKEQDSLNQILTQNLQLPRAKSKSSSSSSSSASGRNLRSSDNQKKPNQPQQQQQQQQQQKEAPTSNENQKTNGKQNGKEKGGSQVLNQQQTINQCDQDILSGLISPHLQQQQQQQLYQPPVNSIASQTRNRSPILCPSATPNQALQSPHKSFSLSGSSSNSSSNNSISSSNSNGINNSSLLVSNNSPSKQQITHGSPKKVSAFNASPSKSTLTASQSDNNQSPKKTILNTIITRSNGAPSPKKIGSQSPQKLVPQSPRLAPSPSPKSTNVQKQQQQQSQQAGQCQQQSQQQAPQQHQQLQNFKSPQNEISTRAATLQNSGSSKDLPLDNSSKQKKKVGGENDKVVPPSPTLSSLTMKTRHQEQLFLLQSQGQNNTQAAQSSQNSNNNNVIQQNQSGQKTSAKSSDIPHPDKSNNNNSTTETLSNKMEIESEESSVKQSSKEKQSPKRKALK